MMLLQATWTMSENKEYMKVEERQVVEGGVERVEGGIKSVEGGIKSVEGGIESVHDMHTQQGKNVLRGLQTSTAVSGVNVVYTVTAPQTSFTPATMFTALNTAIR